MGRLLLAFGLTVVGMLMLVSLAFADNGPHASSSATADGCAGCHRTHTASAPRLLKTDQSTLCFSCHDGTGSLLDTWDGASLAATQTTVRPVGTTAVNGALKGGGIVYSRINSGGTLPGASLANTAAGVPVTSSHIKNTSNALTPMNVIWGSGAISATANTGRAITSMTCGDCHNPHGNGQYRILRPIPNQSNAATGQTLTDETTKVYTTTNYWNAYRVGATTPPLPAWTNTQMSTWCSSCHTRYNASSASSSGDAVFMYRHTSSGSSGMTAPTSSAYNGNTYNSSCLQCHVSHGSNAAMGTQSRALPWPGGTTARGANSALLKIDSRGTCIACHGTTPGG